MTADVLLYNALNETNRRLIQQSSTLDTSISTQNSLCLSAQNDIATNAPLVIGNAGPNQANLWCLIPTLPATGCPWTGDLKVCNNNDLWNCGACCAWTVPVGATCARFQLWGAGAGTGFACCCAFTPFGGTGAYASVIMPVTAGNTYTLCAGCAFCCCATAGGTNDVDGCPSFVTGTGLTNFCAEGGEGNMYCQLLTRNVLGSTTCGYCQFLGGCVCGNNSACWFGLSTPGTGAPGCCFDNMFPMISSCKTFFGSATGGTVFGVRGSFGSIAVNCNGTTCVQHPPIYGFGANSCCACLLTNNYSGGFCRSAAQGTLRVPGAGGFANFKCGGGNSGAGDLGKFGMVCVSFR
jgi:hypothetical protein